MSSCPKEKLAVHCLKKSFGDLAVLEDVTFRVRENELVSLLGLSGSGKSTVFNIIAGLIRPDAGRVLIDGEDSTGVTGRVSYMYQKDLLLPWKNVVDNVSLPLVIKGLPKPAARAEAGAYLATFGLAGFEKHYPFQLSGGMRQRAALLRAFLCSRDLMLLDEPFGGLDAITKLKMEGWLLQVLEQLHSTVLFITHDIEEALFLSDRIYILSPEKPARVKSEFRVEFPKPRSLELTASPEFIALKKAIFHAL